MTAARTVLIPAARVERWFENFAARHGPPSYDVRGGALHASAPDGAEAGARLPFARPYGGPGDPAALAAAVVAPDRWGVLLARVLTGRLDARVCGGDRSAVEAVLSDARLANLAAVRVGPWLDVPDPRRAVLERAVVDGSSTTVTVTEPS